MMFARAGHRWLVVRKPGQFVTIQDAGRRGWKRYGVPRGGAMDLLALATANRLVGNPAAAPALEFMFFGGEYELLAAAADIAVTGGSFPVFRNGERLSAYRSIRLVRGDRLRISAAPDAVWGILAVHGGFATAPTLGSSSTHVRSGIGGFMGRALAPGDALPLGEAGRVGEEHVLYARPRPGWRPIRVVPGPQDDYFEPAALERLLSAPFVVTHQIDRMGYNLRGPPLAHARGCDIVSDGVVPGSLQVPGSGQLIALLADCQPTGGYPKIATVISADVGRLAQTRPGTALRFQAVSVEEANRARLAFLHRIESLPRRITVAPPHHAWHRHDVHGAVEGQDVGPITLL